jgi:hypothetical protein
MDTRCSWTPCTLGARLKAMEVVGFGQLVLAALLAGGVGVASATHSDLPLSRCGRLLPGLVGAP